jgi:hypothetical protein
MSRGGWRRLSVLSLQSTAFVLMAGAAHAQLPPPPPPSTPEYVPPPPPEQIPPPSTRTQPVPQPREHEREPPRREPREHEREPRRPPSPPERFERARDDAPPARTGFQLALRTGVQIPVGAVSSQPDVSMSSTFKAQIPFLLEAGIKVSPAFFLGAYTGLGFGGVGQAFHDAERCDAQGRSCSASSFRVGIEIQYAFQPDERMNPWLGLGVGLESGSASATGGGSTQSSSYSGVELARFDGGLDFRLSRLFGVGPFAALSLGEYSHASTQGPGGNFDGSITGVALHEWITIGVRGVVFP